MEKRLPSFAILLPVLNLLLWIVMLVAPATFFYLRLKNAAHGAGTVAIESGDLVVTLQSSGFRSASILGAGLRAEKLIMVLNAPAVIVEIIVSLLVSGTVNWYPASVPWPIWRAWIYPIYAVPIWFYLGRGIDALLGQRAARRRDAVVSLVLSGVFATLAFGLRFGLTQAERQDQELLPWFIAGFALSAALFTVPFLAWLRQRKRVVS